MQEETVPTEPVTLEDPVSLVGPSGPYGGEELWTRLDPAIPTREVGRSMTTDAAGARSCVDGAIEAARGWSEMTVAERRAILEAAWLEVERKADELALLLTSEVGKPLREARLEVSLFLSSLGWFPTAEELLDDGSVEVPADERVVRRRPIGVAALVLPWNWPLFQLAGKLVPALLAGNTVVVKPSPMAALTVGRAIALLSDMLPPGTVTTVLGPVDTTVRSLLTDRRLGLVSFTGSVATGRRILELTAQGPTRAVLELGGNDPAILLDDVELDRGTIVALMQSMFTTSGQGCQLIKRLLVHRSRHDELVERLCEGIDGYYRLGHGADPDTTMGPLVDAAQVHRVRGLVNAAVDRGAQVTELGAGPRELAADGWFVRPTLVTGAPPDAALVREEQFAPVVPILPFDDDDEAVTLANDGPYGLGSSVWSSDPHRQTELAERLDAGVTYLGNHNAFAVFRDTAVGGVGDSGIGVEWGPEGLLEYTRPHVVSRRRR